MARPKAHTRWTVLPHAPIERLSERLWRIEGALPGMPLRRVMAIARGSRRVARRIDAVDLRRHVGPTTSQPRAPFSAGTPGASVAHAASARAPAR